MQYSTNERSTVEPNHTNGNTPPDDIDTLIDEADVTPQPDPPGGPLAKCWYLRSLEDAFRARPEQQHVIDGLLAIPSLNVVYGAPGSLKSMLMADAAVCVAGGLVWLSPLPNTEGAPIKTMQAPALWIDFDNGTRRTDERFDALARIRNLSPDTPLHYVSMPTPWLDASKRAMVETLAELITHLGAKLIIIDNLGLISGDVEENSAEMSQVMGNLRWLCEETESAIVVIHHQRKGSTNGGGRKGDSLRGHSSIEAALDLALLIEREDQSESVTVTATKVRGVDVFPFGAIFTYRHRENTKELAEAKFWRYELDDRSSDRAVDRAILEALGSNPILNKSSLVDAVKPDVDAGINTIRGRIDFMAATGKIKQSSGSGMSKLYSLP